MPDNILSYDEPPLEDASTVSNDDESLCSIPDDEIDQVLQTGLRFGCFIVVLMFFVAAVMVASLEARSPLPAGGLLAEVLIASCNVGYMVWLHQAFTSKFHMTSVVPINPQRYGEVMPFVILFTVVISLRVLMVVTVLATVLLLVDICQMLWKEAKLPSIFALMCREVIATFWAQWNQRDDE